MPRFNRNRGGNNNWFWIIAALILFSGGIDVFWMGDLLEGIILLVFLVASIGIPLAFFYAIIKLIKSIIDNAKNKNSNQSSTSYNTTSVSSKTLMEKMSKFFANNQKLNIDEETYLVITDKDNINLSTVDIYIRDEYIGSLQDYYNAYPTAYNNLANLLNTYLNKKIRTQNSSVTTKSAEKKAEASKPKEEEKGAAYYIKKFNQLNAGLPNEQVTKNLNELVDYLEKIKKVEDEFPESKDKTVKLYQYYLPMLADILENYIRLSGKSGDSTECKRTEDRLLKTLVLINGALKTISDTLMDDYYSELNVDMRTLESILKKDGLVDEMKTQEANSDEQQ